MSTQNEGLYFRVGSFVTLSVVALVITIFVLGSERDYFERSSKLHGLFSSIDGLNVGSPVRLAGLDVGVVQKIRFPEGDEAKTTDLGQPGMVVVMRLRSNVLERITSDSVASIGSMGLLGDKIVDISLGSSKGAPIQPGDWLKTDAGIDLNAMASEAEATITELKKSVTALSGVMTQFEAEQGPASVAHLLEGISKLTKAIESEDGIIHQLIYSDTGEQDYRRLLADVHQTMDSAGGAMKELQTTTEAIRTSDSFASHLLFKDDSAKLLTDLGDLSQTVDRVGSSLEVADTSLLGRLLKADGEASYAEIEQAIADLSNVAQSMNKMAAQIESGEGSLGALLKDPTVYEDLKLLLSDIKRNKVLRSMVRLGIATREDPAQH